MFGINFSLANVLKLQRTKNENYIDFSWWLTSDWSKLFNWYWYAKMEMPANHTICRHLLWDEFHFVGVTRLERATTCTPCKYASQLRYTPMNNHFSAVLLLKKLRKSSYLNYLLQEVRHIKLRLILLFLNFDNRLLVVTFTI